jgi:CheY-like chemotaxis protein
MPTTGPTVLVVEDEAIVAADLELRLERLGYNPIGSAASGEEAIALIEAAPPHLALLDIHLKGAMDGIALASVLRNEFRVPVVFLTGNADAATLERAKVAESFGYLLKPFDERLLQITIDMALFRHSMEQERQRLTKDLQRALDEVKTLSGLLPICTECKKIENDEGEWEGVESYIAHRTDADFSHSVCPSCVRKLYPEIADKILAKMAARKGKPPSGLAA